MIRDFNVSDHDEFISMSEIFYDSDAVLIKVPKANFEKTFRLIIEKSPIVRGLIFEYDGKVVGYSQLSFTHSTEAGGAVVLIEEIYIKPEFRGKGLGTELFEFLEKEYKGVANRFRLEVEDSNARAAALYERMGYKKFPYVQMIKEIQL